MSVQFDWQVGSDEGRWETLASRRRGLRLNWPWWVWTILTLILVGAVAGGYVFLRERYARAARRAQFQIQSVIDLEARAFARGDEVLYLEQQDTTDRDWFRRQRLRIQPDCPERLDPQQARRAYCVPVLPAQVLSLDLQGDVAWVEVQEADPPVRRTRHYRRMSGGWVHTAPQPAFWREERETHFGRVTIRYPARDRSVLLPLLERISVARRDVCRTIYCPAVTELDVIVSIDAPPYVRPYLESDPEPQGDDRLYLSSPWLTGIPIEQPLEFATETYWVTYAVAARAVRATIEQSLDPLQQAVIEEYARWYVTEDPRQAPILGRIIEENDAGALQEVFRGLRTEDSLDAFVSFWLPISSVEQAETYFETLLRIERDALAVGRQDTFALLQDSRQPWWVEEQQERFVQYQKDDSTSLPEVHVQAVRVDGTLAIVTLEPRSVLPPYLTEVIYYRRRGQDWLHTSAALASR
jgi:hypothetical protein